LTARGHGLPRTRDHRVASPRADQLGQGCSAQPPRRAAVPWAVSAASAHPRARWCPSWDLSFRV